MKTKVKVNSELTPDLLRQLNEKIDLLLLGYPGGVTHRTRGQFIGQLKEVIKELGIKGDAWLPEIMKIRKL